MTHTTQPSPEAMEAAQSMLHKLDGLAPFTNLQAHDLALAFDKFSQQAKKPQPINTHVRLFDLVRYMRAELHEDNLITDEEYGWLCGESPMAQSPEGGSPSPRRLEDYDELRSQLTAANEARERAEKERDILREGRLGDPLLSATVGPLEHNIASLKLELAACEHQRVTDNKYLLEIAAAHEENYKAAWQELDALKNSVARCTDKSPTQKPAL